MRLRFWKLAAAGNDFILVRSLRGAGSPRLIRRLCDRRSGVGADGLLAVNRVAGGIRLRYFNADGSQAFCGNGARCAAWWAFAQKWAPGRMRVWSSRGRLEACVMGRGKVIVSMPQPRVLRLGMRLRAAGRAFTAHLVDTGVPHAVIAVRCVMKFPVAEVGKLIRRHRIFGPGGANVDFVSREGPCLRLRTFERGVEAETWACGTGAVAAAVAGWRLGWTRPPVRVIVRNGEALTVSFRVDGDSPKDVRLAGPAGLVFQGEVVL